MNFKQPALFALAFSALFSCNNGEGDVIDDTIVPEYAKMKAPEQIVYSVVNRFKHDTASFTEGLEFYNGKLYESGGEFEESVLQFGDARKGTIEKKNMMGSDKIFGEGITVLNGKLYQLTYTTNQVFVYDVKDISKPIKTLSWPAEGWGMTNNGTDIILTSAGSNNLYFVDPENFIVRKTVAVNDNNGPVKQLNELEYINGFVWSNIWQSNRIVKIDPATGNVVGSMELNNLLQASDMKPGRTDVLNGIAYDSTSKTVFVTGKRWPALFELRIDKGL